MTTLYLAGPMRGYEKYNFPAFEDACKSLREKGLEIISPHELDSISIRSEALQSSTGELVDGKIGGETAGQILGRDVQILIDKVQAIVFLPGWAKSKGARLEAFVGLLHGYKFYDYMNGGLSPEVPARYIAGVVAAAWMPEEVKRLAGVAA